MWHSHFRREECNRSLPVSNLQPGLVYSDDGLKCNRSLGLREKSRSGSIHARVRVSLRPHSLSEARAQSPARRLTPNGVSRSIADDQPASTLHSARVA